MGRVASKRKTQGLSKEKTVMTNEAKLLYVSQSTFTSTVGDGGGGQRGGGTRPKTEREKVKESS